MNHGKEENTNGEYGSWSRSWDILDRDDCGAGKILSADINNSSSARAGLATNKTFYGRFP